MIQTPTFVVQVSPFAWISPNGILTTVAAQAAQFSKADADIKHAALGARAVREAVAGPAKGRWRAHLLVAPVAVVPYEAHAARMAANARSEGGKGAAGADGQAAGADGQAAGAPKPAPAPKPVDPNKPTPITTQIREWVAANPQATKADAYAQFPEANRSTVNVQFGVARKGG